MPTILDKTDTRADKMLDNSLLIIFVGVAMMSYSFYTERFCQSASSVCHFDFVMWTKTLLHVLHLVFTSCHGIATSCPIVPCSVIGPYVMSVCAIISQCILCYRPVYAVKLRCV